jgi:hypothetical protein
MEEDTKMYKRSSGDKRRGTAGLEAGNDTMALDESILSLNTVDFSLSLSDRTLAWYSSELTFSMILSALSCPSLTWLFEGSFLVCKKSSRLFITACTLSWSRSPAKAVPDNGKASKKIVLSQVMVVALKACVIK